MKKPDKGLIILAESDKYQIIDITSKRPLFRVDLDQTRMNLVEYFGLTHAISYSIQSGFKIDIYTNSRTALDWVYDRKADFTEFSGNRSGLIKRLNDRSTQLLKSYDIARISSEELIINATVGVFRWDENSWGKISNDYGI